MSKTLKFRKNGFIFTNFPFSMCIIFYDIYLNCSKIIHSMKHNRVQNLLGF